MRKRLRAYFLVTTLVIIFSLQFSIAGLAQSATNVGDSLALVDI